MEKAERQFTREIKELAKSKGLPTSWAPAEPLRAELYSGIHRRNVGNAFLDLRKRVRFPELLRACLKAGATDLVNNLRGKMMHVRAEQIEQIAFDRLMRSIGAYALKLVEDERAFVTAVVNAVVEAAAGLFEQKFPPRPVQEPAAPAAKRKAAAR